MCILKTCNKTPVVYAVYFYVSFDPLFMPFRLFCGINYKGIIPHKLKKKLIKNVNVIGKLICCGLFHMKRPKFKGQEQWTKY